MDLMPSNHLLLGCSSQEQKRTHNSQDLEIRVSCIIPLKVKVSPITTYLYEKPTL